MKLLGFINDISQVFGEIDGLNNDEMNHDGWNHDDWNHDGLNHKVLRKVYFEYDLFLGSFHNAAVTERSRSITGQIVVAPFSPGSR
ncbi:hypothetical protein [Aequorivita capsosiphonis]|uniref:hypothetical protein n=1 Tax=Aequorivita capsosiphonis TaxID=487317 RepID=UPI00040D557F|nr:hypothetical protein [Aequorivita capsosiphonis]